uniref:Odorant receptor n=1 Tax=Anopheles epiroticus TaxID=199890 RepID=A0A182PWZ1_9DIPT
MIPFVITIRRKLWSLEREFASNADQFVLLRFLTFVYAIRNDTPTGVFRRTLWCCHLSVPVFVLSSYCYKAYWQLTHTTYTFSTFITFGTFWIFANTVIRGIIFDRVVLERLERFLNDRSFRDDEQVVRSARFNVQLHNNRCLVLVNLTLLFETCIFLGTNLMYQPEFALMYKGHVVGGLFTQLLYGCSLCFWGSLYVQIFAFIYVVLIVFREEMWILTQSFERINECFRKYWTSLDTVRSSAEEAEFWHELQLLIKLNVQRHVELLENISTFGAILRPFSFIQYYGSFTLVAYYCFIIIYSGITRLTVVYFGFIVFLVGESFLFCQILSKINDLIGTIICEMEWYDKLRFSHRFASAYRQVRTSFLIIIIRSQKPLSFTMNGVGSITMARFADLLNSTYSFVMLLLQLKNGLLANLTGNDYV